ncbi:MAG TPA: serine hydrolase domain-containing protein [Vicinamibacterales bacterium]|nr:serine hydrolase domain-containing protein [Vicinamibacterales bacterium]
MTSIRIASIACAALLSLSTAPPADELDSFIRAQMSQRQINGLSLAIIQDGGIEARAYGAVSRGGPPVTATTLFQAGSISKPVAAVGALRLVEQGALSLDEDVNAKLVSWKVPENGYTRSQKVTLRRLLSHTAGLTVHGFPGYDVTERVPSVVQVLDGAGNTAPVRVDVEPGSVSRYSGGGYTVMQLLVTDVTRKSFPEYMREAVLEPLGMSRSTYQQPLPPDRAAETASGHYADRSAVSGNWHLYPEMAAAGLWTTPTDLARFAVEIQQSLAGKSKKVISQAMAREQLTVQMSDYGLGLALSGSGAARTFGHNGRDEGFDALMLAFAETGQGLVVMINANDNSGMMNRIVGAVARKYGWPKRSSSSEPAATKGIPLDVPLEPVTGRYELSNNNMLTLVAQQGSLFSDVNGLPDEEFLFMGSDRFGSNQRDASFRIARGPAGEVLGLTWSSNGKERPVPRIGPLFASIKQLQDPDPSFTKTVNAVVRALAQGGEAVRSLQQLTPGARTDLSGRPVRDLAGVRRVTYLSAQDVAGRQIERHGSTVARVLFYRLESAAGRRWLMVHVTSDGLITDYDVVDK